MANSSFVPHSTTRARARARSLYFSLMLKHPRDMEVEDVAWALGIAVREIDISGCDGRLMRHGSKGVVSINSAIQEAGKKRFTIMHEVGHFDLHGDQSQLEVCTDVGALSAYRGSPAEKEANAFAVEFLLPEALVKPRCHNLRPSFESITKLAEEFNVTFTAAAMRFVDLTSERCALVFSHDSRISWAKRSESFGHFLPGGTLLTEDTHAINYFQGQGAPPKEMKRVFAEAWFKARPGINQEAQIYEQSFSMDRYKSVVTLLWLDNEIEDSDYRPEPGRASWYQDEEA